MSKETSQLAQEFAQNVGEYFKSPEGQKLIQDVKAAAWDTFRKTFEDAFLEALPEILAEISDDVQRS